MTYAQPSAPRAPRQGYREPPVRHKRQRRDMRVARRPPPGPGQEPGPRQPAAELQEALHRRQAALAVRPDQRGGQAAAGWMFAPPGLSFSRKIVRRITFWLTTARPCPQASRSPGPRWSCRTPSYRGSRSARDSARNSRDPLCRPGSPRQWVPRGRRLRARPFSGRSRRPGRQHRQMTTPAARASRGSRRTMASRS